MTDMSATSVISYRRRYLAITGFGQATARFESQLLWSRLFGSTQTRRDIDDADLRKRKSHKEKSRNVPTRMRTK